jgi:hypothetical protein
MKVRRSVAGFALAIALIALAGTFWPASLGDQTFAARINAQTSDERGVSGTQTWMKNVELHLTDSIAVHIIALEGKLSATRQGEIPVFDDKTSFVIDVDSANLTMSTAALSNDLNDYVFARAGAPLKKLTASIKGDELVVKGLLVSKGGVPFELAGTVSVTPEGSIRVHTDKVKAVGIPVKGLMDLLGIETSSLISTKKVEGVSVDKDDLILDPGLMLPPPQIRGHLSSIQLRNGGIALRFGSEQGDQAHAEFSNGCGGQNFMAFRGGTLRFGDLTMSDADLGLVDSQPVDPFDFSLQHYKQQLVAGYAKLTPRGGLCVHVPDFGKLKSHSESGAK